MNIEIELTDQEIAIFRGNCFLRTFKETLELLPWIEETEIEERASNNSFDIEATMHHIENVRHKIVEASIK